MRPIERRLLRLEGEADRGTNYIVSPNMPEDDAAPFVEMTPEEWAHKYCEDQER